MSDTFSYKSVWRIEILDRIDIVLLGARGNCSMFNILYRKYAYWLPKYNVEFNFVTFLPIRSAVLAYDYAMFLSNNSIPIRTVN